MQIHKLRRDFAAKGMLNVLGSLTKATRSTAQWRSHAIDDRDRSPLMVSVRTQLKCNNARFLDHPRSLAFGGVQRVRRRQ